MAPIPDSTKTSLQQRLAAHAQARWPALADLDVRYRAGFAYVTGQLADGESLPLCRLRYAGSARTRGFAIYRASHNDYHDALLPNDAFAGPVEDAFDCACGRYLNDPVAWRNVSRPMRQSRSSCSV